jgi:hypothetical protein
MFIVVQHTISDPSVFWNSGPDRTSLPKDVKLHHIFPTPDGTRAVCLWEADTIEAVRNVLEPMIKGLARNEYFQVENREGFARPSQVWKMVPTLS